MRQSIQVLNIPRSSKRDRSAKRVSKNINLPKIGTSEGDSTKLAVWCDLDLSGIQSTIILVIGTILGVPAPFLKFELWTKVIETDGVLGSP